MAGGGAADGYIIGVAFPPSAANQTLILRSQHHPRKILRSRYLQHYYSECARPNFPDFCPQKYGSEDKVSSWSRSNISKERSFGLSFLESFVVKFKGFLTSEQENFQPKIQIPCGRVSRVMRIFYERTKIPFLKLYYGPVSRMTA